MFGLAIIFFFLLYLVIWVFLVIGAAYFGLRAFKTKKAMFILGGVGFLIGYWPAFGDLIPTLWAHKQLCEREAGFKVYITPEQWMSENPSVIDKLAPYEVFKERDGVVLGNERIGSDFEKNDLKLESIQKKVEKIIDVETKKVLAEDVDFSRGYGRFGSDNFSSIKVWLYSDSCHDEYETSVIVARRIDFFKKLKTKWGG